MSKTQSHIRAQSKAAGKEGKQEVSLSRNRRLDAVTKSGSRATEVERSGNPKLLEKAAQRLGDRRSSQKVLQVPQSDMGLATAAMRKKEVHGTVKNLKGSKSRYV